MNRFLMALAAILVVANVMAETDPVAGKAISEIRKGSTASKYRINKLYVAEKVRVNPVAISVTNNAVVDPQYSSYIISGISGVTDTTNTFTLANAGADRVGMYVQFVVDINSTQLVSVADSGNVKASAAWVGDTNDVAVFYATASNIWVQVGEEDN